jgi:epoxide hydrolase
MVCDDRRVDNAVTEFVIDIPDSDLDDLRHRLRQTRWPERELVDGWDQGVPIDYLRELIEYWAEGYDWRATETRVNRLPQFVTTIDGLAIHFLHVRSPHPEARPLIMTHGWPGSFFEYEATIGALTDPVAHGGDAADAFHVVIPSLPGYGFSAKPEQPGWDMHRIARAWVELVERLGYPRFAAVGGDWGSAVTTSLALQRPDVLTGIHLVGPLVAVDRDTFGNLTEWEDQAIADMRVRGRSGTGYSAIQSTRPQTLGYALADSPAGQCAWIMEKVWDWSDHGGDLDAVLSRDQVLDNVSLYWLTGSAASSARLYWESFRELNAWFLRPPTDLVTVPTGATIFPAELPRPSRRWAAKRFANIQHWGLPERGGHFGAWERPETFISEVRTVFRAIRE